MSHLSADELIDAVEADAEAGNAGGVLDPARRAHLTECEECRRQFDDLASVLNNAKQASIPEPSPLFWSQFSARVNNAIDRETTAARPGWLRWQVLLPLGAVAMIILALMVAVPQHERVVDSTSAEVVPPVVAEDTWASFADLVGDLDVDVASEAGVIEPGIADQAVLHLTAEEQQELSRLLQAELSRAKS